MLDIQAIEIRFPEFHAHYTLTLPRGALAAVIGPSGGGKTSLFNALSGFEPVSHGRMMWNGQEFTHLAPAERPCALLFQDHNLLPHLTARENVGLGLAPSLRLTDTQWAEADQALSQVGLEGMGARFPAALSGGQRQRVALARALVREKPILLLDEPFGALDPGLRKEMIRLVDALRRARQLTLLMSLHTPEDALGFADHMIFIADGHILLHDTPERVLASDMPALRRFLGT
jgi:thiamine transport system ATP-binding protein